METLNIQCIEQQQVLITLTLTDSNGAPVDLTQYAVYAASVGAVDPYCRRAARLEWAAAINNECSAFIITAPGHDIARAPWKYTIYLKNRQLGLEWAVVTGRVELTPRACGTDGISPAAYSISAECTPSGLVNVSLDATVGSISDTLEEVKASAALASSSAANAHADLEDARKAATTAAQAATTAAADANNAMDAAARAEKAAMDAPKACAPFVGQVQAAAVQAQQAATHAEEDANRASTAATTATEKAQVATDAAAAAATSATDLASARDTAVQAATTAQAAQQTAQLASTTATTAAENAREYAEDAQQAQQASATSGSNAATAAQQASDSASAAAASAQSAHTSAETAVSAKSDLETARDTATAAATTATDAAAAAASSETNASAAATAAATAQAAAEAAQAQADTDARACAIYDQRVAANATAAADSATAAADSATSVSTAAENYEYDELYRMVNVAAAAYGIMQALDTAVDYISEPIIGGGRYRLQLKTTSEFVPADIIVSNSTAESRYKTLNCRVLYAPKINSILSNWGNVITQTDKPVYLHMPTIKYFHYGVLGQACKHLIFSPSTNFDYLESAVNMLPINKGTKVTWAPNTTMPRLTSSERLFYQAKVEELPDGITFEKLKSFERCFYQSAFVKLPSGMVMVSAENCDRMFYGATQMEIEDIVRVCSTIKDLQALPTPKTANLGLPITCKHNGENVTCDAYINAYHPDFIATMQARGWNVSFGDS